MFEKKMNIKDISEITVLTKEDIQISKNAEH